MSAASVLLFVGFVPVPVDIFSGCSRWEEGALICDLLAIFGLVDKLRFDLPRRLLEPDQSIDVG